MGASPIISKAVAGPTAIATFTAEMGAMVSTSYAGLIQVEARAAPGTTNSNMASYILHATKQPSAAGVVSVISQQGLLAGVSANHPSFTFSIVADALTVTPIGAASGSFSFWITAMGGIGVYA